MLRWSEKDVPGICTSMIVGAAVFATAAHAGEVHPTSLRIAVSDGYDSGVFLPDGTIEDEGVYNYRDPHFSAGGDWTMAWDFNAVPQDAEAAWVTGNFVVRNNGDEDLEFIIDVEMPLLNPAAAAAYYGSASLTVSRGTIAAMPEDQIYAALIDQLVGDGYYEYPYELTGGGNNSDGAPVSGQHTGAEGTIGIRLAFRLSAGARATIQSGWGIDGVGVTNGCPADIDEDGTIGFTDILRIISRWGPYEGPIAPEDLNADNVIGIDDIFVVLIAWGEC